MYLMTEVTDDTATDDEADTVEDTADTDTEEPEMTEDTDDTFADDETDTAHVISPCSVTVSVHDHPRDQCMGSHVISA